MRTVLITGANSYIGTSFEKYVEEKYADELAVDTIDMVDGSWRGKPFKDKSGKAYDCVFHVAGIAHADVGRVTEEVKRKYYAVNTDLAIEAARKAKKDGCSQFVFMSSAIIYGDSAPYGRLKRIARDTKPHPSNFYGDSKWRADKGVRKLGDSDFIVTVLRPPMIYGKGSKGNYQALSRMVRRMPVFPDVGNERSMLYIENLCEFLCQVMIRGEGGIFWPQNSEYGRTSEIAKAIAEVNGHRMIVSKPLNWAVALASHMPGKIGRLANKAFGNMSYDQSVSTYGFEYQKVSLGDSIRRTERDGSTCGRRLSKHSSEKKRDRESDDKGKPHILVVTQYFHPETFRINDMAKEWVRRGYRVTVLTGIPNYPMGRYFEGYDLRHRRREAWNGVDIIRIPLIPRGSSPNKLINWLGMVANYLSFVVSGWWWKNRNNVQADLVYSYEVSPMTQVLVGIWYAKRYHIPHYLYVTDLWPENVEAVTGIHNKTVLGAVQRMVDYAYRNSDRIFTSSKSFVSRIEKRGIDRSRIEFWPQYAEEFYKPMEREGALLPQDGTMNLVFAGSVGVAQGLDVLVKAAVKLKSDRMRVRFNVIGDGRYLAELQANVKAAGVQGFFNFIPRQPADGIPRYLAYADALLITLSRSDVFSITLPAKTQSCFACGRPILVSADGEIQDVVNDARAGLCSDAGDADGLARNIKKLICMSEEERISMAFNALSYSKINFGKEKLLGRLDQVFLQVEEHHSQEGVTTDV